MALKLNEKFLTGFVGENEVAENAVGALAAKKTVMDRSGAGNDFLGWVDLPVDYDKEEFARIKAAAERIKGMCPRRILCRKQHQSLRSCRSSEDL